eukprot:CAMPEP_0204413154 /NCGR_PEP_ID=MMETSP0470-20130426/17435_1 /ASSEMBLY_ACC=CAM_ASM_000385 /TAXON_ID=2969 /ORGANISM="Oxyrrhis marina" /LENGTH=46 /DNA_ID= /DNA_START= /DNA_END= /DNA_ORIENTATION=
MPDKQTALSGRLRKPRARLSQRSKREAGAATTCHAVAHHRPKWGGD